jgi:S1-C subfamily serine protease
VVIAQDGYVLTNDHVAAPGKSLHVRLADGERVLGELVGADPHTDLAVVRARGDKLAALSLSESRPAAVGQLVVAIGNPFRFERSVSLGLISALERSLPGPNGVVFEGLVQTDAAINPGNSGGPLVSARGEVVGINTAVIPYAQGMGFAVNAKTATWVASLLIQKGEIRRRYLGIAARSVVLPAAMAAEAGQPRGVHVLDLAQGSPAEAAGVMREDYLVSVHGTPITSVDDVHRLMVLTGKSEVELEVLRAGKRRSLVVRPLDATRAAA